MLAAQWMLLAYLAFKFVMTMALQGRQIKDDVNGWNLLLLMVNVALLYFAGAFSHILP